MSEQLAELWRTEVPGEVANVFLADRESGSLFAGDGWGVAYAGLRLHRLDLSTGVELAQVRTRHQAVSGMTVHMGRLYAATGSRLFEVDKSNLTILRQWNKGLVRHTMKMEPTDSRLVVANWLAPTIGIFDLATGVTRRLKIGSQPLIVQHSADVKVISGFHGGMWTLDRSGKLRAHTSTPPVAKASAGKDIWAALAGPAQGGVGEPPLWTKLGTNVIIRLTGGRWQAHLSDPCREIYCDDKRGLIWCIAGEQRSHLEVVSQATGKIVAAFVADHDYRFQHVDPATGIALAMEPHHIIQGNVVISATSRLVCYSLESGLTT